MPEKVRGGFAVAVMAMALTMAPVSLADDGSQPIREFDIKTIEALGVHMYSQDQEAWHATDILLANHSPAELGAAHPKGWIVDEMADRDVVRFLHEGANGLEAAYDVTFVRGAAPALSVPGNRTLSPDEITQAHARLLAASNFTFRCSNDPANAVAFRDPTSDAWLVWIMSATHDPNLMMLGGHIRFTISADGKSVIHNDALSRGCNILSRKDPGGETPVAYIFTHLVSNSPVETHVFASLSYGAIFFVGTPDGSVWRVEKGAITKTK